MLSSALLNSFKRDDVLRYSSTTAACLAALKGQAGRQASEGGGEGEKEISGVQHMPSIGAALQASSREIRGSDDQDLVLERSCNAERA